MFRKFFAASIFVLISSITPAQDRDPADDAASDESNANQEESTAWSSEAITVLGSRIPRTQVEGPAPVTTITAEDILQQGYQDVGDLMRAVTQNAGETQTTQSFGANTFTPGAQQVDLRGLGPSRTLVLVNGRRVADFPMPYGGNSNVADISNIPIGLIARVEILSGAASSIYGSDAISGVVNFVLKDEVDGSRIDVQIGTSEHGDGTTYRLTGSTGFESGAWRTLLGVEYSGQEPLWGYDRKIQDSTADNPTTDRALPLRNFLRTDEFYSYLDPGPETCAALSNTNRGTTVYGTRPGFGWDVEAGQYIDGHFCGSSEAIGYGMIQSDRQNLNLFSSTTYDLSSRTELFLDAQIGFSDTEIFNGVKSWYYVAPDGNEEGTFYNPLNLDPSLTFSGSSLDNWYRLFTPEEIGGLENYRITNESITLNITPGVRGSFGSRRYWDYEAYYNYARYEAEMSWPEIGIEAGNNFFLGQPIDDPNNTTGYQRFDADPTRLFTALTPEEYAQIAEDTVYKPVTYVHNVQGTINTMDLFELPAGPVGFAAVFEAGKHGYDINPDPKALRQYYVGIRDSDGEGDRDHYGAGTEFRIPVFDMLSLSAAARYDHYSYANNDFGELTYNFGVEFRPLQQLLIRGAIGTGFRAPDLHYVYRGEGTVNGSGADYFACRTNEADPTAADCVNNYFEGFINERGGNLELLPETAQSMTAGFVWAPSENFDLSVDYFRIDMDDQVANLSVDQLLRDEAACRLGTDFNGNAVDASTPTCVDALNRVQRYESGALEGELQIINVLPINIAQQETDGIDVEANARFSLGSMGNLSLGAAYTYVFDNKIQQYPQDPIVDKFVPASGYEIPRDKGRAYVTWSRDRFSTTLSTIYTGEMTNWNWDDKIDHSFWYYLTAHYKVTDRFRVSATIDNLLDSDPVDDPSHASYPYYNSSWYDSFGRSYYLQATYKFGGRPL